MALSETIKAGPTAGRLDHIPGHMGMPVFGSTFEFLRDPFAFHQSRREKYGLVYKFSAFGGETVVLHGADALEYVLMDRERNFSSKNGWDILEKLFPKGLMLRDFEDHRAHRRIMQVAFKPQPMRDYMQHLNQGIAATLQTWAPSERFEFYPAIKDLTLELGASVFLGLEMGADASRINQAFVDEVAASLAILRRPWPGSQMRRGVNARAFLLDYFRELIPARRAGNGVGRGVRRFAHHLRSTAGRVGEERHVVADPCRQHAHGRQGKPSLYLTQLREKQKVRRLYGLLEKQFAKLMNEASRQDGLAGENLLRMLEQRLDNAVYRAGFATSRRAARQLVGHGHFMLNGRRVDIPSIRLKAGDEITVRPKSAKSGYFSSLDEVAKNANTQPLSWLKSDVKKMTISVTGAPQRDEAEAEINEQLIVEYYSR